MLVGSGVIVGVGLGVLVGRGVDVFVGAGLVGGGSVVLVGCEVGATVGSGLPLHALITATAKNAEHITTRMILNLNDLMFIFVCA